MAGGGGGASAGLSHAPRSEDYGTESQAQSARRSQGCCYGAIAGGDFRSQTTEVEWEVRDGGELRIAIINGQCQTCIVEWACGYLPAAGCQL